MTLDQALLSGLVVVTAVSVIIALLVHRTQAKWRQRDLLRELIGRWAEEVAVPTEVDAIGFDEKHLRLPIEKDAAFTSAFKLAPKRIQGQYGEFIEASSAYIKTCHKLYEQIAQECTERMGFPLGRWGEEKDWPKRVLLPNFVLSIYEQVLGIKRFVQSGRPRGDAAGAEGFC